MKAKPVSESAVVDQKFVIRSEDITGQGTIQGGKVLQMADQVASHVAMKHTGMRCVTSGIDAVRFFHSAKKEDLLFCKCSINRTWDSTLELGVKVVAEDFRSLEHKEILSAYFTFTAIDEESNPVRVAPILPETPDEIRRFEEAEMRRKRQSLVSI